ncbi:MAG: C-GCAxxG-C-C family protein [Clostridiales Family XIII bacterium]|jgi:predicted ATPase|nr:C-GCAxxG-C-C family protein [Clostridiales Family XIII bacterium]
MENFDVSAMNPEERVQMAILGGLCCSKTIAKLCLEDLGKQNDDLVESMEAFCKGMGEGQVCGTLAAACAMLYVADPAQGKNQQRDLMDWFYDRFGALDCEGLVHGDPFSNLEFCHNCVMETYIKLREDFLMVD